MVRKRDLFYLDRDRHTVVRIKGTFLSGLRQAHSGPVIGLIKSKGKDCSESNFEKDK